MMNGIERVDRSLSLKAHKFRKDADQTWNTKSHNFMVLSKVIQIINKSLIKTN